MPKKATTPTNEPASKLSEKLDLTQLVSRLNGQYGPGTVMRMNQAIDSYVDVIPSGDIAADTALGVGGLPRGRIIEVYGNEASGKTTFCLSVIAEAQKLGGVAAFIDVEHALDPKYAKLIGINLEELLVSQPDCGEDALTITEILIRSNAIDVIVIDSVAALVTKQELDGAMGDVTMGAQARLMSQAMRRLTAAVSKSNCICIFINQIREKIGVMFGNPETTSGGRALRFFASIRIELRKGEPLKSPEGRVLGNKVKFKVVKNKVAPPHTEAEFEINYAEGISKTGSLMIMAAQHGILEKKGAWYSYNGELIGQGTIQTKESLATRPALYKEVYTKLCEKLRKEGKLAPAKSAAAEEVPEPTDADLSEHIATPVISPIAPVPTVPVIQPVV